MNEARLGQDRPVLSVAAPVMLTCAAAGPSKMIDTDPPADVNQARRVYTGLNPVRAPHGCALPERRSRPHPPLGATHRKSPPERASTRTVRATFSVDEEGMAVDSQPSSPAEDRVYFRDIKPNAAVDSLAELLGPAGGVVELSHSVLWAPGGPLVDLDEPGGDRVAYRAVLAEGLVDDLVQILDRDRLIALWPTLTLPQRVRQAWESRFPELSPFTPRRGTWCLPETTGPGLDREVAAQREVARLAMRVSRSPCSPGNSPASSI